MSAALAERMIVGGIDTRWPRPPRKRDFDCFGETAACEMRALMQDDVTAKRVPFDDICMVGGAIYIDVMRSHLAAFAELGWITPDAKVTAIYGAIGEMRRDIKKWLVGQEKEDNVIELRRDAESSLRGE
jgi:hypothetical protein